jgi:PBP1b-binding outer membrane lipoprotein LpoB
MRGFREVSLCVLAVIALAMLLAGCEGDRIKQSKNPPTEQRAAFGLLA